MKDLIQSVLADAFTPQERRARERFLVALQKAKAAEEHIQEISRKLDILIERASGEGCDAIGY